MSDLVGKAQAHLWPHFSRLSELESDGLPIIVRGEGCFVFDERGKRYLDGLAGLFAVQIGYSHGEEVGEAVSAQLAELPFYTNWGYAHPAAIELAAEVAELAPEGLDRVFWVSGGSEAVESAWKLAREYHSRRGERRWKAISRYAAYHGTTMGALSINGVPALRQPFEPLVPGVAHVSNTVRYHRPEGETEAEFTAFLLAEMERTILNEGPDTVALVILEPVQNSGGAIPPPEGYFAGVRALCDRYGILLCADEVITGFGRVGDWFGSLRYDIRPDLITCAKGLSSAYGSIGAVIAHDRVVEPFRAGSAMFTHGMTFGGHPVQAAIARKNIEIMKRLDVVGNVARREAEFRAALEPLLDLQIVGDLRGAGFFWALELVRDSDSRTSFDDDECEWLLRGFLSKRLLDAGLICRADDRGDPALQLSPPLIAGTEEIDRIAAILGEVLTEAQAELARR